MSSGAVVATKILEIPSCEVCGEIGFSVKSALAVIVLANAVRRLGRRRR